MISSVAQPAPEKRRVTVLYRDEINSLVESYRRAFEDAGHPTDLRSLEEDLPSGQDIISLLELEAPFFDNIDQHDLERVIQFSSSLESANLLWLTRPIQMGAKDPRYAQVLGFARTLRSEKQASFTTFEIDNVQDIVATKKAVQVYEQIFRPDNDPQLDPDYEFALHEGIVYSSRYHWVSVRDELASAAEKVVDKVLKIGQKGMIDSLRWEKNVDASRPLKGQEVAVRPHTVGVNFRVSPLSHASST
ncbi:uncharacterized protein LDX57_005477 [Aspergillus melleus]|uniref:uncharacterized protein n=1 Tax=Aspergillus melleus TaxID=138277 RepID=UPI001E8CE527|nr:uncharacterized protein LDX57_005477 [Aspergillus melleus]KAH8427770.1 hypothetical protein LDX57_005477 [Aspergillus melleus]